MKVFLYSVSSELHSCRLKLANQLGALKHRSYEVKVQEDFTQRGLPAPNPLPDLSYTQWRYDLAQRFERFLQSEKRRIHYRGSGQYNWLCLSRSAQVNILVDWHPFQELAKPF